MQSGSRPRSRTWARWSVCLIAAVIGLVTEAARCGDWPQWRGPMATGVCREKDLPLSWGPKDGAGVLWKAKLPDSDDANSSPIVWRDRVFVTTTKGAGHRVACFRASDGKGLWQTRIGAGPFRSKDTRGGGLADATPATDGQRVYVLFGTAVLAALKCDDGKIVWKQPLKKHAFDVTTGSSPILAGGSLILFSGLTDKTSNITAYDPKTGRVKWETPLPKIGFGHSTPAITSVGGRLQLIVSVNDKAAGLLGVDPASGKILWSAPGDGETASPAVGSDMIYCDSGRGGSDGYAVDLTKAAAGGQIALKWKLSKPSQELSSPIIMGKYLYRLGSGGKLLCRKLADGSEVYRKRLDVTSRWASPIATADGRVYFATAGKSVVIQAGPTFKVLAVNDLGDASNASPAVANGRIFLKGRKYLYCIAKGDPASRTSTAAAPTRPETAPQGKWVCMLQGWAGRHGSASIDGAGCDVGVARASCPWNLEKHAGFATFGPRARCPCHLPGPQRSRDKVVAPRRQRRADR